MSNALWTEVDRFITEALLPPDADLDAVLEANAAAGLPAIDVSPPQAKLLHLLARATGARAVLEIGTLGGYSTIWLARALSPGGRVTTLEIDPLHAAVARSNFRNAGVADLIDLHVGPALDTLPKLAAEGAGPFDLIFIDADKPNNAEYLAWALRLSRAGTLIVGDNVVRRGDVVDPASTDPNVVGTRAFYQVLAAEPRVTATAIQTVGTKGYDGFALALVTA
jgi:predicted O-methyltransferase YrrM